jgi:two-component system osmolarity sensor histidine kinase EnvZ
MTAMALALLVGLGLAVSVAFWLARRLTQPLARLEAASALIGQGGHPLMLVEAGPRELVSLSRRFNTMAQQVSDLLAARTTLLAGVSHDLRTPLARMRLALEMLKDAPNPALIERLERDIDHMNRLIGNVLELARGLQQETPVDTDLPDFLHQIAADFSTPSSPVTLTCPPGHWPVAPTALQRAVGNLLQNAQRYAPGTPVALVARFENKHCHIGVLDRGPGIPPAQREAVFQPFHRLDASRSPATGGSGLGLAIVRELARANGWRVSLTDNPGGGLQAWLELP